MLIFRICARVGAVYWIIGLLALKVLKTNQNKFIIVYIIIKIKTLMK